MSDCKGTYKPEFCFVVTQNQQLPFFDKADTPTKIVTTPLGFYFFFEDREYNLEEQVRLAKKFNGNSVIRRIYYIDGREYCQYTGKIPTTEVFDSLEEALRHLRALDKGIELLTCYAVPTNTLEELRAKRASLIADDLLYAVADRMINIVLEGPHAMPKMRESNKTAE